MKTKFAIFVAIIAVAIITLVLTGHLKHAPYQEPTPVTAASLVEQKPIVTQSTFEVPAELQDECSTKDAIHLQDSVAVLLGNLPSSSAYEVYICDGLTNDVNEPVTVVEITGDDKEALLTAYKTPNAYVQPEVMCTANVEDPLIINIDFAGELTPVYAPVNVCGFPSDEAKSAYLSALDNS